MEKASTLACRLDIFCTVNGHGFITVDHVIQSIILTAQMIKESQHRKHGCRAFPAVTLFGNTVHAQSEYVVGL